MDESQSERPCCGDSDVTCSSISFQYADVNVPIRLKPFAITGHITTECYGDPTVAFRPSKNGCSCELMITQTLCIKIPIEYGATADVGESIINCKKNYNNCADLGK